MAEGEIVVVVVIALVLVVVVVVVRVLLLVLVLVVIAVALVRAVVVVAAAVPVPAMVLAVVRMSVPVDFTSSASGASSSPSPLKATVFSFTPGEDFPTLVGDETGVVAIGLIDAWPEAGVPRLDFGDIRLFPALMNSPRLRLNEKQAWVKKPDPWFLDGSQLV